MTQVQPFCGGFGTERLTTQAIQGVTLVLQCRDHVHGGHALALGVLRGGDGIVDHGLQEDLQPSTGRLTDEARGVVYAAMADA